MPAAKERGDRGRWNYPSQATAAFEMVLSPGAGIASAAWGQAPPAPRRVPQRQGQPATSRASPPPARDTRPCSGAARSLPPGTCLAGSVSAASGLMPGAGGGSPRRNKLWDSPFPPGRGAGGMGARRQAKGRVGRRQTRQATPADSGTARSAGNQPGKPPASA